MTGRTVFTKHMRQYVEGYDISGYTRDCGPLVVEQDEHEDLVLTSAIKGVLLGHANIMVGTLNGVFDNTASTGMHTLMATAGTAKHVMIPIGDRAAPVEGVPTFCAIQQQLSYATNPNGGLVTVSIPFGRWPVNDLINYTTPWGHLIHASGAETGVNSGTNDHDHGAATTEGGYMMYQLFSVIGSGTVTLKVQDSSVDANGNFGDLLTSGTIAHTAVPKADIVALALNATVERYTRWQLVFDTITSATFALAFVRGLYDY